MNESDESLAELLTLNASVDRDGTIVYRDQSGSIHRRYGPAVIQTNGYMAWVQHNRYHREDGPAIIYQHNGRQSFYLNGIALTEHQFDERVRSITS